MNVTDTKISLHQKGTMLAFANVEFDGCMTVKGFKLFKGKDGRPYDIGFPAEKDPVKKNDDGSPKWWPTVFIDFKTETGKKLMDEIRSGIVSKYESETGASGGSSYQQNQQQSSGTQDAWSGGGYEDDIPF